jgi:hypothetical protein
MYHWSMYVTVEFVRCVGSSFRPEKEGHAVKGLRMSLRSSRRSRCGSRAIACIHIARQLRYTGFDSGDAGFDGYSTLVSV